MTHILTAIISIALGALAGYWWGRLTDVEYWKPYILNAYKRGREAGMSKRGKG